MGDGIVGQISKGPVHTKVDDYVNHKNAAGQFDNRAGFLTKLIQAGTFQQYLQLLLNDVGLTQAEVNYLASRWYDPASPKLMFQNLQPIYPVLRQGLIKALQEAGSNLLLDSYWMPVGAPSLLAVTIAKSSVQVTRTILTPPSHMPAQPRNLNVAMWAVTPQEHPPVAVNHTTSDGIVKAVNGNVVTWQRRELTRPQPSTRTRSARTRPQPPKRRRSQPSKRRRRR